MAFLFATLFSLLASCAAAAPAPEESEAQAEIQTAPGVFRLGVIADINGSACQARYPATSTTAMGNLLSQAPLDHLILTGDAVAGECMSYSGKTPYREVVQEMWQQFDRHFYRPAFEKQNLRPILAPGNHDAPFLYSSSRATFRTENEEFQRYWEGVKPHLGVEPLRVAGANDRYPYYWAYVRENILFVVLQSTRTHTLSDATTQKKWLRAVLRSPEARAARARIAFGHVPVYPVLDPSVGGKYSEILEKEQVGQPDSLMDLLLDHQVELLIMGHSHVAYPAELTRARDRKTIKILSMPCGHAPRKLYSKKELAARGYAVVELSERNEISVSVRNWADGKAIPAAHYPAEIPLGDAKIQYRRMKAIH